MDDMASTVGTGARTHVVPDLVQGALWIGSDANRPTTPDVGSSSLDVVYIRDHVSSFAFALSCENSQKTYALTIDMFIHTATTHKFTDK